MKGVNNMNIQEIEKMMMNDDDELLILYKGNDISCHITNMINRSGMTEKIVNRKIIVDTMGEYNMIYNSGLDIERVTDLLTKSCMGWSIKELMDKPESKDSKGTGDIQLDLNVL